MFSDEFRQCLSLGKYTKWAADLNEWQLEALLWMVGEFGHRSYLVLEILDKHKAKFPFDDVPLARAKTALRTISRIVGGERLDTGEATRRIREAVSQLTSSDGNSASPGSAEPKNGNECL